MMPLVRSILEKAFQEEDKPIIEAAYANRGDGGFWAGRPVSLGIDVGAVKARRLIEAKIRNENEAAAIQAAQ